MSEEEVNRYVEAVLHRSGTSTVAWRDGSFGILHAPAKWCAVVAALADAMRSMARGEPLPELVPPGPKDGRRV